VCMALARDYVRSHPEKIFRKQTDLISVIVMRDTAEIVMSREPSNFVLFNELLDMRVEQYATTRTRQLHVSGSCFQPPIIDSSI